MGISKDQILDICQKEKSYFNLVTRDVCYKVKGIFYSEMLLFCAIIKYLAVPNIIESGRGGGISSEIIARYFEPDKSVHIWSIEVSKYTKDSLIALKRLYFYRNLSFYFANALSLLPQLTKVGPCTVLIDGPKGKYALKLAAFLLKNPKVKAVFILDSHKDTRIRSIIDEFYPNVFSSDNLDFVKTFGSLDKPCWEVYKNWEGYKDWGPYKRGKVNLVD